MNEKKQIWAEVVTIGSELVLGQLVDTNAAFIAGALAEAGIGLAYHTSVGDDWARMKEAMETALNRADVVITTGGIGPTEDDFTREVAAEVLDCELVLKQELLDFIEELFRRLAFEMKPNNRKQAYIPEKATAIHNPRGTAPAFQAEKNGSLLFCLPGVPAETEPLIREAIIPAIRERFELTGELWVNRVLKVCGVGESNVDAQIKDIIRSSPNPIIGLQASPGEIKVRLTARADSTEEAERLLDEGEAGIRERIGDLIFGYGNETLAGNVAAGLVKSGKKLAVCDGATKGKIAADIGGQLPAENFSGALITTDPASFADFIAESSKEPGVVLAISSRPGDDDKVRVEIRVIEGDVQMERTLDLGGRPRMILQRAATMAMFTLWEYLMGR